MDATKKYEKLITDKEEIEGLPATALGLAAQTAVSKVSFSLVEMHVAQVLPQPLLFFLSGSLSLATLVLVVSLTIYLFVYNVYWFLLTSTLVSYF